jgi:hypothetical protein
MRKVTKIFKTSLLPILHLKHLCTSRIWVCSLHYLLYVKLLLILMLCLFWPLGSLYSASVITLLSLCFTNPCQNDLFVCTSRISVRCPKLASSVQHLFYHLLKLVGIVFV